MTDTIETVEIDLPVRTVYNQWTQFEDFPLFMKHVDEVRQIDDTTLEWKASILGVERQWTAEITEQTPDQRIAWKSIDGTKNSGVVTFHALNDNQTRVLLQIDMDPEGLLETIADWGGWTTEQANADLETFKTFIEDRERETGAWRGEVDRDERQQARTPHELAETEPIEPSDMRVQ